MPTPADLHEVVDVIVAILVADFFLPWAARELRARLPHRRKGRRRARG